MSKYLKLSATLLFLFANSILYAQDCTCIDSFENTVNAYEKNYSLYMYKVTDENRDLYEAHTDLMREKAKQTEGLNDCKILLEKWLKFFRDGHTYIVMSTQNESEIYNESIEITEQQFKADYKKKSYDLNPLLGIWKSSGYTVALMPNPKDSKRERDYVGVVLESSNPNWKKGEIKMELNSEFGTSYQINYMMGNHSKESTSAQQTDRTMLEIGDISKWIKIWPEVENSQKSSEIALKSDQFHISYIDEIPYLRLPDFYSVESSYVDSLMKAHHEKIIASDFMVVDIRGNSGGNDGTYFPVLPYLLSGPVTIPVNGFWLSEENTDYIIKAMAAYKGLSVEEYKEKNTDEYKMFNSNRGKAFFKGEGKKTWTFNADTLYNGPKKVIILTDKEVASSGETFVYRANQSDKVVVYGQNTAGVVDGFNGYPLDIGCFIAVFPTSYRAPDLATNPIDPYGIAPDVYLDEKEDVLAYAIEHMRQLIKNEKK